METQIRVMDLEVDLLSTESLQRNFKEYLENDYLNVVHLISLEEVEEQVENEEVRQEFEEADLILPGERAILANHHVDVLQTGGMVVDYQDIGQCLCDVVTDQMKCYFIMRNKKEAKAFYQMVFGLGLPIESAGIYTADGEVTEEALINDINTLLPDIIFLAFDQGEQEKWILENKAKLNSKLCICFGAISKMMMRNHPYIPMLFQKLHLCWLYEAVVKIPTAHFLRLRIFRRKMANYNSKKKNEENES